MAYIRDEPRLLSLIESEKHLIRPRAVGAAEPLDPDVLSQKPNIDSHPWGPLTKSEYVNTLQAQAQYVDRKESRWIKVYHPIMTSLNCACGPG